MTQKFECNTNSISKLRNSLFQHVVLESLRKTTYLTKTLILLYCCYVSKGVSPTAPLSMQSITNAYAPQPLLSHQTTHIQSPIHLNFVINIPHGIAVLTALFFVIPQTLWKCLSDRFHCLEFFTLSTINKNY